jgi:hypothetical protein
MTDGNALADESVGVTVPDDHVGAFVAEAFEDPERSTTWEEVVDEVVAAESRAAWDALSPTEQVRELLAMADGFDERAVDRLAAVPLDRAEPTDRIDDLFAEAERCRRNADRIRDGIADAYADGRIGDAALVDAVETYGFETGTVAERERLLESVTDAYGYDFRPYGGTLMEDPDGGDADGGVDPW